MQLLSRPVRGCVCACVSPMGQYLIRALAPRVIHQKQTNHKQPSLHAVRSQRQRRTQKRQRHKKDDVMIISWSEFSFWVNSHFSYDSKAVSSPPRKHASVFYFYRLTFHLFQVSIDCQTAVSYSNKAFSLS